MQRKERSLEKERKAKKTKKKIEEIESILHRPERQKGYQKDTYASK